MTYPGLVLLVGVGVGLATFLYYMFTESNRENGQQQYSRNQRPSDHRDDWTMASPRTENMRLSRRSSSHSLRTKEGKDFSNKDDVNCSICQDPLNEFESVVIELKLCKHRFHEYCIDKLKKFDPKPICPNCRKIII